MSTPDINKIINGNGFLYRHTKDNADEKNEFILHNHNDKIEILIFIAGKADYVIEGSRYNMMPGDIVIANENEMHKMIVSPEEKYERIVIKVHDSFFCMFPALKNVFTKRRIGTGNKLSLSETEHQEVMNLCRKIEQYSSVYNKDEIISEIIQNIIKEILFLVNQSRYDKENSKNTDERIKKILVYINENLTSHITLDSIADNFFINKFHLCRIFKKNTGMTLNRYINYKRLLLAKELHGNGENLTTASMNAGFDSYSTFYKVYKKELGKAPGKSSV